MQAIQINVSVNIGMTQELCGFLTALLGGRAVEAVSPAPAQVLTQEPAPAPTQAKKTKAIKPAVNAPDMAEAQQDDAMKATEQPSKVFTEVDVREAMERTRRRIEGENYKEETDGELYQKWHRRLTAFFKNTSNALGSDKPSTLPDSESREKFIKCCDAVYVKGDELLEDCPF